MDSLTFRSFNSTGLDSVKAMFFNYLCNNYNVNFLAIQEHFKFINTDKFFKRSFGDFSCYVKPGYRAPEQLTGRVKAGLAQMCSMKYNVKKYRVNTHGFRVQAQVLELLNSKMLWLNTYLPTDP